MNYEINPERASLRDSCNLRIRNAQHVAYPRSLQGLFSFAATTNKEKRILSSNRDSYFNYLLLIVSRACVDAPGKCGNPYLLSFPQRS